MERIIIHIVIKAAAWVSYGCFVKCGYCLTMLLLNHASGDAARQDFAGGLEHRVNADGNCDGHGDGTARALPLDDERTQALKDVRCADGIQRAYGFGVDYDVGVLRQPLVYSDAAERRLRRPRSGD